MNTPTVADMKAWLGIPPDDTTDDLVLQDSLNAALVAQARAIGGNYPCDAFGDPVFTDDLTLALFLRAQRLAARRNSPEGVVGITGSDGDFVGARLPSADSDVIRIEGAYVVPVTS
jgi:hypothetical protein